VVCLSTSQWKIILLAGIVAVLGLTYSFIKTRLYKQLYLALEDEKSGGGLGSALGLASSLGLDLGGGGEASLPDQI
jgi:hypothetical protein